ncbi:hypothetical protein BD309DRAFT_316584 [Dichomitus squalens]|nr:hypothetical protein BD309DRAFT_316584 [Dichomitus squalens]
MVHARPTILLLRVGKSDSRGGTHSESPQPIATCDCTAHAWAQSGRPTTKLLYDRRRGGGTLTKTRARGRWREEASEAVGRAWGGTWLICSLVVKS